MTEATGIDQLMRRVRIRDSPGDRLGTVLTITLLPVPIVSALYASHRLLAGTPEAGGSGALSYLIYGCVNLLVVAILYVILTPKRRESVFVFHRPSAGEVAGSLGAFLAGLGVYQVTARVNAVLGVQMSGFSYSLNDPMTVFAVVAGAVVLAPVTEEILYRGLVLGALTDRGIGSVSATVVMTALFAVIHLPNFGVGGTIFISAWGSSRRSFGSAMRISWEQW
ncbi:type II CAAX prenyl endopeptidase Rce1 family protein [Halobaculum halobium]|uniref:CPBP family glutamic-type intramembrane protease n=1 Tax=Halobaculum halobium TaxID=3032281 RepID=UPI00361CA718